MFEKPFTRKIIQIYFCIYNNIMLLDKYKYYFEVSIKSVST